mgnify:CR=1 FL=1
MFGSPIRNGVLATLDQVTEEFEKWSTGLIGTYEIDINDGKNEIRFSHQEDQAAYLLTWTEDIPLTTLLIPLLRRVMPSIIANDIIGVSPMTGPVGQIFAMRSRYQPQPEDEDEES